MVTKVNAPALSWQTGDRSETEFLHTIIMKGIGDMKVRHYNPVFNELPLWTAARVRDLKRTNPATSKLRKQLGVSESVACVLADLSGLGSKEGFK